MKKFFKLENINGVVQAPVSKSYLQRLFVISLFTKMEVKISVGQLCEDSNAALIIIKKLGAKVIKRGDVLSIKSALPNSNKVIKLNCGESGLSLRMLSAIASVLKNKIILNGSGSLLKRPLDIILDSLQAMGVKVDSNQGLLPIAIDGTINCKKININGNKSSQFLTGMLIGLPSGINDYTILVKNLKSKPYIDLTLKILDDFNIKINHRQYQQFVIKGNQKYITPPGIIIPEGDFSGAAFLLVAGAVGGYAKVVGLNINSTQADRAILSVLKDCGAKLNITDQYIEIKRNKLSSFQFDATDCPDLFPPLTVLASFCKGRSIIRGVSRLENKESNRKISLIKLFKKMGIDIKTIDDSFVIKGGGRHTCVIDSFNDHRIAMAAVISAIGLKKGIYLTGSEAVKKSYPVFYQDLEKLGGFVS